MNNLLPQKEIIQPWPLVKFFVRPFVQSIRRTFSKKIKKTDQIRDGKGELITSAKLPKGVERYWEIEGKRREKYRANEQRVYNKLDKVLTRLHNNRLKSYAQIYMFPGGKFPLILKEIEEVIVKSKEIAPDGIWSIDPRKIEARLERYNSKYEKWIVAFSNNPPSLSVQIRPGYYPEEY